MKKTWGVGMGGVHPRGSSYSEREWMVCHIVLCWPETLQFLVMATN